MKLVAGQTPLSILNRTNGRDPRSNRQSADDLSNGSNDFSRSLSLGMFAPVQPRPQGVDGNRSAGMDGNSALLASLQARGVDADQLSGEAKQLIATYGRAIDQVKRGMQGLDSVRKAIEAATGKPVELRDNLTADDGETTMAGFSSPKRIVLDRSLASDPGYLKMVAVEELADQMMQRLLALETANRALQATSNGRGGSIGDFGTEVQQRVAGGFSQEELAGLRTANAADTVVLDGETGEIRQVLKYTGMNGFSKDDFSKGTSSNLKTKAKNDNINVVYIKPKNQVKGPPSNRLLGRKGKQLVRITSKQLSDRMRAKKPAANIDLRIGNGKNTKTIANVFVPVVTKGGPVVAGPFQQKLKGGGPKKGGGNSIDAKKAAIKKAAKGKYKSKLVEEILLALLGTTTTAGIAALAAKSGLATKALVKIKSMLATASTGASAGAAGTAGTVKTIAEIAKQVSDFLEVTSIIISAVRSVPSPREITNGLNAVQNSGLIRRSSDGRGFIVSSGNSFNIPAAMAESMTATVAFAGGATSYYVHDRMGVAFQIGDYLRAEITLGAGATANLVDGGNIKITGDVRLRLRVNTTNIKGFLPYIILDFRLRPAAKAGVGQGGSALFHPRDISSVTFGMFVETDETTSPWQEGKWPAIFRAYAAFLGVWPPSGRLSRLVRNLKPGNGPLVKEVEAFVGVSANVSVGDRKIKVRDGEVQLELNAYSMYRSADRGFSLYGTDNQGLSVNLSRIRTWDFDIPLPGGGGGKGGNGGGGNNGGGKGGGNAKAPNRPNGKGKTPGRPNGKGKTPGRPSGKGKPPGRPNGKGKTPGRPSGKGKTPGRPNG